MMSFIRLAKLWAAIHAPRGPHYLPEHLIKTLTFGPSGLLPQVRGEASASETPGVACVGAMCAQMHKGTNAVDAR